MKNTRAKSRAITGSLLLLLFFAANHSSAQSAAEEFFENKIRPVLVEKCYLCHSAKLNPPMGGLVLDTKPGLAKGGASGLAVVPGNPDESRLLRALRYNDLRLKMPPTGN